MKASTVKIIDYKAGNAPSVLHAVKRLGYSADFARCAQDIEGASHIILPGVGSAGATMDSLREMGLIRPLEDAVLSKNVSFMGICVGMQILFDHSEEGDAPCLGWLGGRVIKFSDDDVRVPQMGWNRVSFVKDALPGYEEGFFYFVNSYYAKPEDKSDIWGEADYGGIFTAAVCKGNIYGTQFHLEKSGEAGLKLLDAFLRAGVKQC